jgi:exodeoxyribonuclease VII large subunit
MINGVRVAVRGRAQHLGGVAGRLQALSPLSALARGYSVALDQDGHVLRTTADFRALNQFKLRVSDGSIDCSVDAITEEHAE